MTRILVTGSTGLLGTDLVALARRAGHDVAGSSTSSEPPVDLTDAAAVERAISDLAPEVIVHAAAWTAVDACELDPARAFAVNAEGTAHVVAAAAAVEAHVILISTDYVFDGTKPTPYIESDPPRPLSVYGRSKLAAEQMIGERHTIVRTSWLCGHHGPNMVTTILRLASQDDRLHVVDDQVGCPTFTPDLAQALLHLAYHRWPGTFHLTNQGAVSRFEFARTILEHAGLDPDRVAPIRTSDLRPEGRAPRPANSVLDGAAWRSHDGPALRPFRQPLDELIQSLRSHRPPPAR